ncbi:MAG: NAD(P)-dependent oxidoreductase [Betaproteobacteria bacterium]|nr:NAD(P)-dependent oxidoreductase [Betaproteobacteria bacterium]
MTNHKERIGIIGLGIMGGAMAEALLKAGYTVTGFDVVSAAKQRLKAAGGKALANSTRVLEASDVVLVSVATSAALAQVAEQLCQAPKRPAGQRALVVETSTLPIEDKQAFAASMKRVGLDVMDCPISGTAVRMKDRSWTMFVSGSKAAYKRVEPVLRVFTDNLPYVGAFGNGSKMKFAANHLVAIYNVACAESVNLARKMGLDPKDVLALFGSSPVIGHGVMRLRVPFMIDRSYTPATMKVEVWQKDMQVIGDMAKSVDCPTPLFSACAPIYSAAMAQGLAQSDTASVSEVLARMAGIQD